MQRQPLRILLVSAVVFLVLPCGCSDESDLETTSTDKTVDEKSAANSTDETQAKTTDPTPRRRAAKSPDAAVQQFVDEIVAGKADVVWDSLPPQYRADINELVRGLAEKVDAEVWRKSFETWVRLVGLLGEKQALVAQSGMLSKSPIPIGKLEQIAPHIVAMFATLLDSDLKDTAHLKAFDGRQFLSVTGSKLINHLKLATKDVLPTVTWQQYAKDAILISALSVDGDSAVVEVLFRGSRLPPTHLKMSRVDGYWIPAELAAQWAKSIASARREISKMPPVTDEARALQMKSIAGFNALLDGFAKVETVEEFDLATGQLLSGFFPSNSTPTHSKSPVEKTNPSAGTGTIHIVVTQLLNDKAIDELVEQWERLSDRPETCEVDIFTKDGHTVFVVTPVSDLKKFAEGIDFVDSVDLDPKHNAIRITLPKLNKQP